MRSVSEEGASWRETLAGLALMALRGVELRAFMGEIPVRVREALGVRFCEVLELLDEGDRLLLRAGAGWNENLVGRATVSAALGSQAGYALGSEAHVMVENLRQEARFEFPSHLQQHGIASSLSAVAIVALTVGCLVSLVDRLLGTRKHRRHLLNLGITTCQLTKLEAWLFAAPFGAVVAVGFSVGLVACALMVGFTDVPMPWRAISVTLGIVIVAGLIGTAGVRLLGARGVRENPE